MTPELPDEATPIRPRILYVVHRVPYPPDKGDRIRNYHLLRYLASQAQVDLACLADEPVAPETDAALRRLCHRVTVAPLGKWTRWSRSLAGWARGRTLSEGAFWSPELAQTLRQWASDGGYRAVLASASSLVPYLQLPELRRLPATVDLVDVDSQKWFDYAAGARGWRSWIYRLEGARLRRVEQELPHWAHALTLVSQAEADIYRQFAGSAKVHAIGNGVDLNYFQPAGVNEDRETCVFVGALDYRPNIDGACWFARAVWPEIRRRRREARLLLVGRQPAPAVQQLGEVPGVEVVGQVPDVRPFVAQATAIVVPLRIARGVQNKVLEALAMCKATVASPEAMTGLSVFSGEHLLSATTPADWTDSIMRLFCNASLRQDLGRAGRAYVETHHRWERCLAPFGDLLGMPGEGAAPTAAASASPAAMVASGKELV